MPRKSSKKILSGLKAIVKEIQAIRLDLRKWRTKVMELADQKKMSKIRGKIGL
jgi:hypothetical protein